MLGDSALTALLLLLDARHLAALRVSAPAPMRRHDYSGIARGEVFVARNWLSDELLQALFLRFQDVEWEYRKLTAEEQTGAQSGQWWKKVAAMPKGKQLSEGWVRELGCIVAFAGEQLKLCRAVNDACLERMPVPEAYVAALPKNAGDVLSKSMHKALNKDGSDSVVRCLLHAYPDAAAVTNLKGQLPLHVAVEKGASDNMITDLLAINPEACAAGSKASAANDMCELCAAGTYQDTALQTSCQTCAAGYACARGAAWRIWRCNTVTDASPQIVQMHRLQ